MRIKKFRAKTFQEGKVKVLKELGEDAIVLSTRIIPPSPPEMEELIELVAAVDTDYTPQQNPQTSSLIPSDEKLNKNDILSITSEIYKEISSLKTLFWSLSDKITYSFISKFDPDLQQLGKLMLKNGFSSDFVLNNLLDLSSKNFNSFEQLRTFVLNKLSEKLYYAKGLEKTNNHQIIAFIGPTGSGKSFTLIKIAVLLKLLLNSKIAIVSVDNQKVGGWEQLQILCAVSNLPCSFAQSKEELISIIEDYKKYDFIMIDTSGGSPKDENYLSELEHFLKAVDLTDIILVISVTTSRTSYSDIISTFRKFNPTKLILTKFDEVSTIGHIYEGLIDEASHFPLIYLTNGTSIPNSIEPAKPDFIAKYLINHFE